MAGNFVAASSQYLKVASAPATAVAFSVSCLYKIASEPAAAIALIALSDTAAANDAFELRLDVSGGAVVLANSRAGGINAAATVARSTTGGVWHQAGCVFAGSQSRTAYYDGSAGSVNTTSSTPGGIDTLTVGNLFRGATGSNYFGGNIAEVGIWNVAFTAADMLMLAAGVSPLQVKPASLVYYNPLVNNLLSDFRGGLQMTNSASPVTAVAHPRVMYPHRRWNRRGTTAVTAGGGNPYYAYAQQ